MITTVAAALQAAQALGLDRLDAHLLLAHHLQRPRTWVIANDEADLPAAIASAFTDDCQRRADAVPLAYLLGQREFHGLSLRVTPDVLVPRPDTETLVDWAIELAAARPRQFAARPLALIELGTGSGAIALAVGQALLQQRVPVCLNATDVSPAALAVAEGNARALGLPVSFRAGSWWEPLPADQRFDLVLSNPPYIRDGDPHLVALRHEPRLALTSGEDGLQALRQVIAGAASRMNPGAWILLEHGWDQGNAVAQLLREAGLAQVSTRHDIGRRERCTGACRR